VLFATINTNEQFVFHALTLGGFAVIKLLGGIKEWQDDEKGK
jgi:hypothetical protein